MPLIKNRQIIADDWQLLRLAEGETAETVTLPAGLVLVPLAVWQARKSELASRAQRGVWLAGNEDPAALAGDLEQLAVVAVDFPKFADGRGYSIARLLRERYGYRGEVRAIGDVLRDQLFYMHRVGIDAFDLRPDRSAEDALKAFDDFPDAYQTSVVEPQPLFRRSQA